MTQKKNQHTGKHSVFGYPGNKASASEWIIDHLPQHRIYVEPFGGAAGVLANKPESHIEVYNDLDGDLVNFFDVLRERGDELVAWLRNLPYARAKYEEWATRWHDDGWRPDDPVRRAGILFFLQASSYGSKYRYEGGFAVSRTRNQPQTYHNQINRLEGFADRFRGQVIVENQDWRDCFDKWDDDDSNVLFFADPPYLDATCRYKVGTDFDHEAFGAALADLDARWAVTYDTVPGAIADQADEIVARETKYEMAAGTNGESESRTERLALSYDPDAVDPLVDRQSDIGWWSK